jgi:hypothetical protein
MTALLALFLQHLPDLFQAAKSIPVVLDYIKKTRATFQETGEWSAEAESAFTNELEDLKTNPPDWWKPEHAEVP